MIFKVPAGTVGTIYNSRGSNSVFFKENNFALAVEESGDELGLLFSSDDLIYVKKKEIETVSCNFSQSVLKL